MGRSEFALHLACPGYLPDPIGKACSPHEVKYVLHSTTDKDNSGGYRDFRRESGKSECYLRIENLLSSAYWTQAQKGA